MFGLDQNENLKRISMVIGQITIWCSELGMGHWASDRMVTLRNALSLACWS